MLPQPEGECVSVESKPSALAAMPGACCAVVSALSGVDNAALVGGHGVEERARVDTAVAVAHEAYSAHLLVERQLVGVGDDGPTPDGVREVEDARTGRCSVPVNERPRHPVDVNGVARAKVVVADGLGAPSKFGAGEHVVKTSNQLDSGDELLVTPVAVSEVRSHPTRQVREPFSSPLVHAQKTWSPSKLGGLKRPQDQVREVGVRRERTPYFLANADDTGGDAATIEFDFSLHDWRIRQS